MLFTDFPLHPKILAALEKQGYTAPTPIQFEVIKYALEKKNIV